MNVYTLSMKKGDYVKTTLRAVSQFTSLCKEEGVVGRVILDIGDLLCDDVIAWIRFESSRRNNGLSFRDYTFSFEAARVCSLVCSTES